MRSTSSAWSGLSATAVGRSSWSSWLRIVAPSVLEDLAVDVDLDAELVRAFRAVAGTVLGFDVDLHLAGGLAAQRLADRALHAGVLALVEVDLAAVRLAVAG